MQPLTAGEIRGTWGTVLLPIAGDGSIDLPRLADEVDRLVAAGLDGLYTNGTAGEFYTLDEAEFDRTSALVAERCAQAGLPFQIGCAHAHPQAALSRVVRARALAPSAIQVILPDWLPLSEAEQAEFLARIAEAADPVPLVLYNPPHAKQRLALDRLRALADAVPALVGFKLGGGDEAWHRAMAAQLGHLSVFVPGHALATGWSHGAAGAYSNVACLGPVAAKAWNRLMAEDLPAALALETRIQGFLAREVLPLRDRLGLSNPALDKLLAHAGGWADIGLTLRWPYRAVPEEAARRVAAAARRDLPEFPG